MITSCCEFFSLIIFLPSFETLKASVKSIVMLPVCPQGSFSFIFISICFLCVQAVPIALCYGARALSSLAPTLVHQAFCSSFYPSPHLSGSKIWLVFGSSTSLLAHTGCSYLSSVSNACSITYQHFHMAAFSRSFYECAIYFWGSDFPVDKLCFIYFKHEENFLGFQPGHVSIRLQGSGCYLYLVSTGFLGYHTS